MLVKLTLGCINRVNWIRARNEFCAKITKPPKITSLTFFHDTSKILSQLLDLYHHQQEQQQQQQQQQHHQQHHLPNVEKEATVIKPQLSGNKAKKV